MYYLHERFWFTKIRFRPKSFNNIFKQKINIKKEDRELLTKQKAKEHKKAAISHYLEAKKIKNTYLLEDIDNSDSSDDESLDGSKKLASEINDLVEELA